MCRLIYWHCQGELLLFHFLPLPFVAFFHLLLPLNCTEVISSVENRWFRLPLGPSTVVSNAMTSVYIQKGIKHPSR